MNINMLKNKNCIPCLFLLVSILLSACDSVDTALNENTSDAISQSEVISEREGFSIHEISDDLFARMKAGNTYKRDCVVPYEDLRYQK